MQAQQALFVTHNLSQYALRGTMLIQNGPHAFHTPLIRRLMCQAVDAIENCMSKYPLGSKYVDIRERLRAQHLLGGMHTQKIGPVGTQPPPFKNGYQSRAKTLLKLLPIYSSHAE